MKTRTREIAHTGIFGSQDNPQIVTENDLKEISETFKDQTNGAPVTFGHYADPALPRLAVVKSVALSKDGKSLSAEIDENDVLSSDVDKGYFPECSIAAKRRAVDGKLYLHHLAYLGEEPADIKDLRSSIMDELQKQNPPAPQEKIAASDTGSFIELPSTGAKTLYLSDAPIKPAPLATNEPKGTGEAGAGKTTPADPPAANNKQEALSMDEKEQKALQEQNEKLKQQLEQKDKLLSDQAAAKHAVEKEALSNAIAGKVTEDGKEKLLALADSFDSGMEITLSDGDKKRVESPLAVLTEVFSKMPLPVEPGELHLSDTEKADESKPLPSQLMMQKM